MDEAKEETSEERLRQRTYQIVAVVVSALGLLTACGLGSMRPPRPATTPVYAPVAPNVMRANPRVLRFPETAVGVESEARSVLLTNTSGWAVRLERMTVSGEQGGSFRQGSTCGQKVEGYAHCEVVVVFRPTVAGPARAELIVEWVDGETQTIKLLGSGR